MATPEILKFEISTEGTLEIGSDEDHANKLAAEAHIGYFTTYTDGSILGVLIPLPNDGKPTPESLN